MECHNFEECEFNGQPECRLPDSMECPHGVKADKPTNADRIRAMNDEELAKFLYELYRTGSQEDFEPWCLHHLDHSICDLKEATCRRCAVRWLKMQKN